ncbi:HAUS augmin-like complex subunit 1 [Glandiceps talaboti]
MSAVGEKHRKVQVWLENVFAGSSVPQYEINTKTVNCLYDLMQMNEKRDMETQLVTDDLNQKAAEYHLEAVRLAGILHNMGLSTTKLSKSGSTSLTTLATVALTLELKDGSMSSYLVGLTELSRESMITGEARQQEKEIADELSRKTQNALVKSSHFKKFLHALEEKSEDEEPKLKQKCQNEGFLQAKAKQYKERLQYSKDKLNGSGVDASIYHDSLLKKAEELKELKKQISPLRAKLDTYHQLPADPSLAQVKVEEAKKELATLESEILKGINLLTP